MKGNQVKIVLTLRQCNVLYEASIKEVESFLVEFFKQLNMLQGGVDEKA